MFLSDYYCINAPMRLAHDVLWKSTATFVSDTNGIINISQTHLVLVRMKVFQQWDYFLMPSP